MSKPLPIGISDFKQIIEGNFAYVDKTLLIQELIEQSGHVSLIPRLRRFGKTLNLSMLRYFFEKGEEDTSHLFQHLKIWEYEKYRTLQGKFPVIFISLKVVFIPSLFLVKYRNAEVSRTTVRCDPTHKSFFLS